MAIEETLAEIELFSEMPRKDLERLAKCTIAKQYKKGFVIVREGDLGIAFYAVAKGRVEIYQTAGGMEKALATLHEGDFFGEMALFDNQVRSASARALEDCECLVLTKWDFNAEVNTPESRVAIAMLPILARRIRALDAAWHTQ
jgi:CRP/FNR family cyclic AMP-dependent transcriptional regulator